GMATDPICGMTVDPRSAAGKHEHNGQTYYFCSQHCVTKFRENPERYDRPAASGESSGVEQPSAKDERVTDPVCGMTVDPKSATGKHEHNGQTYYFCSQHCLAK